MLKDITFGQYYDCKSLLHRLDARIKIILMIIFIVFIFISKNIFSLLFAAISVLAITIISRVPFKLYLKNMKAILPVLIFTAIINIFYGDPDVHTPVLRFVMLQSSLDMLTLTLKCLPRLTLHSAR